MHADADVSERVCPDASHAHFFFLPTAKACLPNFVFYRVTHDAFHVDPISKNRIAEKQKVPNSNT
jgi:hypothetical protein